MLTQSRMTVMFALVTATVCAVSALAVSVPVILPLQNRGAELAEARKLLESVEPRDRAWGAWRAGESALADLAPLLEVNLARSLSGKTWQDDAVMDTTLDALIRVGARSLPVSLIESAYMRRRPQAMILASRMEPTPELHRFLFKVMHDDTAGGLGLEWFTAANLLLAQNASGIAFAMLRDMQLRGVILLCDTRQPCLRRVTGRNGIADGAAYFAAGFPPWPRYDLQRDALARGVVVAVREPLVSIGYSRHVSPEGLRPGILGEARRKSPSSPTTAERLLYLSTIAPESLTDLRGDEERPVVWESPQTLDRAVESFRVDLTERYRALILRLGARGLLTPGETAELMLLPAVTVSVEDLRGVRRPL